MAQQVKTDWPLFFTIVVTVGFGLILLYSSSSVMAEMRYGSTGYFLLRQVIWVLLALAVMMAVRRRDYRRLNTAGWAFGLLGFVLILLVIVFFADPRTHRWLRLGPVGIQPSELAKPALILFLAYFVALRARAINDRHTLMPAAITVGLVTGFVMIGDIGTAAVLVATAAVVFYVAGLEKRYIRIAVAIASVGLVIAIVSKPYRLGRIIAYLDPEYTLIEKLDRSGKVKDYLKGSVAARDPGYQVRQSRIAVGAGGVVGLGLMQGRQKLFYLPEAHTDFIYAVVGEELGLLGCAAVIGVFLVILWRGVQLVRTTPDDFGRYLALGVTTMVVVQAFINIGVVLGVLPTKGIPLPMISYGGSSLLSTLASLGVLLSVSEHSG